MVLALRPWRLFVAPAPSASNLSSWFGSLGLSREHLQEVLQHAKSGTFNYTFPVNDPAKEIID